MRLTLIRHGATDWNEQRRFQGRTDVPLSAEGLAQASAIARALREEPIDVVYSSDLVRALQTASLLAQSHAVAVVPDARLREFDFGRWEGRTWGEIIVAYPHLAGRGSTAAKLYTPEGGESFAQVRKRVRSFLKNVQRRHAGDCVAVITHAGPLHAMISLLDVTDSGVPSDHLSLKFAPGSITRISIEKGRAQIVELNARGHLASAE